MKAIGSKTKFGKIAAVGFISGERYYWMIDKFGTVSMMPAIIIEDTFTCSSSVNSQK